MNLSNNNSEINDDLNVEGFWDSNRFPNDSEMDIIMRAVEQAMEVGIFPVRIGEGSSGAYFALDNNFTIRGVFKPKSEEPYAALNPKWGKWIQRKLAPCCFGRGCLPLNQGYLSEAGASVVDDWLQLGIVPKTKIIRLAAPSFNYGKLDIAKAEAKLRIAQRCPRLGQYFNRLGLPFKLGSFQAFKVGYVTGTTWLHCFQSIPAPPVVEQLFLNQFQRMVILDYVIRNTDRNHSNWLVKCDGMKLLPTSLCGIIPCYDIQFVGKASYVNIAAIDNGLAFPFKHPDEWRSYPYHWADLRYASVPFMEDIKDMILPKISDPGKVNAMGRELHKLYSVDIAFNDITFDNQMGLIRGQCRNLQTALEKNLTPLDLIDMLPMKLMPKEKVRDKRESKVTWKSYKWVKFPKRPFFSRF